MSEGVSLPTPPDSQVRRIEYLENLILAYAGRTNSVWAMSRVALINEAQSIAHAREQAPDA